jgi:hypothetical protein
MQPGRTAAEPGHRTPELNSPRPRANALHGPVQRRRYTSGCVEPVEQKLTRAAHRTATSAGLKAFALAGHTSRSLAASVARLQTGPGQAGDGCRPAAQGWQHLRAAQSAATWRDEASTRSPTSGGRVRERAIHKMVSSTLRRGVSLVRWCSSARMPAVIQVRAATGRRGCRPSGAHPLGRAALDVPSRIPAAHTGTGCGRCSRRVGSADWVRRP